jgi:hypothetical protein
MREQRFVLHLWVIQLSRSDAEVVAIGHIVHCWTAFNQRTNHFQSESFGKNRAWISSKIAVNFSLNFSSLGSTFWFALCDFPPFSWGSRRLISWPQQFHLNESPLWSISLFHKASFSFYAFEAYSEAIYPREKVFNKIFNFFCCNEKIHRQNKKIFIVEIMSFYYFFSALLQQWKNAHKSIIIHIFSSISTDISRRSLKRVEIKTKE